MSKTAVDHTVFKEVYVRMYSLGSICFISLYGENWNTLPEIYTWINRE